MQYEIMSGQPRFHWWQKYTVYLKYIQTFMNKYHYRNPGSGVATCSLWYVSHDRVTEPWRAGATEGRSRGAGGVVLGEVEGVPAGVGGMKD